MDAGKLFAGSVAAALLCALLRPVKPELALALALAAGAMLLGCALSWLNGVRDAFSRIMAVSGLSGAYMSALFKVLGIAYLTELAAQTCLDLGERGLSEKVGLCGRLMIFTVALPLLTELLETIIGLVP